MKKFVKNLVDGTFLEKPARSLINSLKPFQIAKIKNAATTKRKLVFMHMPKCAGTSVQNAFRRELKSDPSTFKMKALRASFPAISDIKNECEFYAESGRYQEFLLLYYLHRGAPFISGHYPISRVTLDEFGDTYKFVTLLRDPVDRFISQYTYDKMLELESSSFAENQRTQDERKADLQQYLRSWRAWFVSHIYTWMFGGHRFTNDLGSADVRRVAKKNLQEFDIVGFTNALPTFLGQIEKLFGFRLEIRRDNTTQSASSRVSVDLKTYLDLFTEDMRRQVAELCRDDCEVYDFARNLFEH